MTLFKSQRLRAPAPLTSPFQRPGNPAQAPLAVLLLDDSDLDRKRITRLCKKAGLPYKFTELSDPADVPVALDARRHDLALIDYRLTQSDGVEVAKSIHRHPAHLACAMVMVTSDAQTGTAIEAMKAGCSDVLDKSDLDAERLKTCIAGVMDKALDMRAMLRARGIDDRIDRLIQDHSQRYCDDLKPLVTRMLRDIRSGDGGVRHGRIEADCLALWDAIDRMQQRRGRPKRRA